MNYCIYNKNNIDAVIAAHIICSEYIHPLLENIKYYGISTCTDYEYLKDNIDILLSDKIDTVYIIGLKLPKNTIANIGKKCNYILLFNNSNDSYNIYGDDYKYISEYDIFDHENFKTNKSLSKMIWDYIIESHESVDEYSYPKYIDILSQDVLLQNGLRILEIDANSLILNILDIDNNTSDNILVSIRDIGLSSYMVSN